MASANKVLMLVRRVLANRYIVTVAIMLSLFMPTDGLGCSYKTEVSVEQSLIKPPAKVLTQIPASQSPTEEQCFQACCNYIDNLCTHALYSHALNGSDDTCTLYQCIPTNMCSFKKVLTGELLNTTLANVKLLHTSASIFAAPSAVATMPLASGPPSALATGPPSALETALPSALATALPSNLATGSPSSLETALPSTAPTLVTASAMPTVINQNASSIAPMPTTATSASINVLETSFSPLSPISSTIMATATIPMAPNLTSPLGSSQPSMTTESSMNMSSLPPIVTASTFQPMSSGVPNENVTMPPIGTGPEEAVNTFSIIFAFTMAVIIASVLIGLCIFVVYTCKTGSKDPEKQKLHTDKDDHWSYNTQ